VKIYRLANTVGNVLITNGQGGFVSEIPPHFFDKCQEVKINAKIA